MNDGFIGNLIVKKAMEQKIGNTSDASTMGTVMGKLNKAMQDTSKVGVTNDSIGSETTGTIMGKLNHIIKKNAENSSNPSVTMDDVKNTINSTVGTAEERPLDFLATTVRGHDGLFYEPIFEVGESRAREAISIEYNSGYEPKFIREIDGFLYLFRQDTAAAISLMKYETKHYTLVKKTEIPGNTVWIDFDGEYFFAHTVGSDSKYVFYKIDKNLSVLKSKEINSRLTNCAMNDTYLYGIAATSGCIVSFRKNDFTQVATSSGISYGYAWIIADNTNVYAVCPNSHDYTRNTIVSFRADNLAKKMETAVVESRIDPGKGIVQSDTHLFFVGSISARSSFIACKMRKEDMFLEKPDFISERTGIWLNYIQDDKICYTSRFLSVGTDTKRIDIVGHSGNKAWHALPLPVTVDGISYGRWGFNGQYEDQFGNFCCLDVTTKKIIVITNVWVTNRYYLV